MIEKLVSVLIPCYNHEKYIVTCLESIKQNTYDLKEIILIDDGSTDSSFEIAEKYLENNKDFFKGYTCIKQKNIGVTKTLNRLVDLSHGEFIAVLASDDYLTENSILDRVDYLETANKNAVIGKAFLVDSDNNIIHENASKKLFRASSKMLLSKYINKELIMRWSVVGPSLLLRRTVYDQIGLYNENLKVEDREFYLRLLNSNLLGYLDKNVCSYRVHSSNSIRSKSIKQRAGLLKEISEVNISYCGSNSRKDEKLFLSSYKIDKMLIENEMFEILLLHKATRAILIEIYLFIISKGI